MTAAARDVAVADQLRALTSELEVQEAVIERGVQAFTDIGLALAKIRDDRLYRQEYTSFEVYCQTRWQLSRSRAYRLIDAASVTDAMEAALELSPIGDTPIPTNEGQARELVGLAPDDALDVMRRANEATNGKPTASAIRDARNGPAAVPTLGQCIHCNHTFPLDRLYEGGQGYECDPCVSPDVPEQELPPLPENYMDVEPEPARPVAPITGIDGKTYYPQPVAPKEPRRKAIADTARDLGLDIAKIAKRIEDFSSDDRIARNRSEVAPRLRNHLESVIKVCQDLNQQLTQGV